MKVEYEELKVDQTSEENEHQENNDVKIIELFRVRKFEIGYSADMGDISFDMNVSIVY